MQITSLRLPVNFWPSVASFGAWLLAAAGVAYWFLHLQLDEAKAPLPTAVATTDATLALPQTAKALGYSTAVQVSAHTTQKFKIWGVIAAVSGQGSALISTDGEAPKAYRVGQALEGGWTLQSLTPRGARLGNGTAAIDLELINTFPQ